MRDLTRRDLCAALSALALAGAGEAASLGMQVHASEAPVPKPTQPAEPMDQTPRGSAMQVGPGVPAAGAGGSLGEARVFRLEDMPVRTTSNGGESRDVAHGTLATGESVNLHQTTQPAGATPSSLHVIRHSEFILVREGEVEFSHEDAAGRTVAERVGPGGVIYVAFGTNHRVRNAGSGPAKYFVVAIGGDAK